MGGAAVAVEAIGLRIGVEIERLGGHPGAGQPVKDIAGEVL